MNTKAIQFQFDSLPGGEPVYGYRLENDCLEVEMIEWGAVIRKIRVKQLDRDVVLGYDTVGEYIQHGGSVGASVGRVANRIAGGQFCIAGKTWQVEQNDGVNHIHGGANGCGRRLWQGAAVPEEGKLTFTLCLKEEEDRYPGDLTIILTVELVGNMVRLAYSYSGTKDSPVNLTNHTYFNLSGEKTIENHEVKLQASGYAVFGAGQIPTGQIQPCRGTAFDFQDFRQMGSQLTSWAEELREYGGYDHYFQADAAKLEAASLQAVIRSSDLTCSVYSDAPGFQLYTGNGLKTHFGKGGAPYVQYGGLCIEPQFIPNDINLPGYGRSLCRAGETGERQVWYQFNVLNAD